MQVIFFKKTYLLQIGNREVFIDMEHVIASGIK